MTAETQSTVDEAQNQNVATVSGDTRQVAEMSALAFNAGKDVVVKTDNGPAVLHEEFSQTRDEYEMTVETDRFGAVRLSFRAFYVTITEGATAEITN